MNTCCEGNLAKACCTAVALALALSWLTCHEIRLNRLAAKQLDAIYRCGNDCPCKSGQDCCRP